MIKYLKSVDACKHFNVDSSTLRRWARYNQIETIKTKGGHYRYKVILPDLNNNYTSNSNYNESKLKIIYCRVSSKKQESDLERQKTFLIKKYPNYKLISDVGSGINFTRPGFKWILQQLFQKNIEEVVVAYTDRFSRFGFELFEWIFSEFGAILRSVHRKEKNSDLVGDIMEIFTVFTAKYHGQRKYKTKNDKSQDSTE